MVAPIRACDRGQYRKGTVTVMAAPTQHLWGALQDAQNALNALPPAEAGDGAGAQALLANVQNMINSAATQHDYLAIEDTVNNFIQNGPLAGYPQGHSDLADALRRLRNEAQVLGNT
jgi:hypothetical protein